MQQQSVADPHAVGMEAPVQKGPEDMTIMNTCFQQRRALLGSKKLHRNRKDPSISGRFRPSSEIVIKLKNQTRAAPRLCRPIPTLSLILRTRSVPKPISFLVPKDPDHE